MNIRNSEKPHLIIYYIIGSYIINGPNHLVTNATAIQFSNFTQFLSCLPDLPELL